MMSFENRIMKAQAQLVRVQAIADVYALLEEKLNGQFRVMDSDDDGNFITDDDGNFVYRDKKDDEWYGYPYYDVDRNKAAFEFMKELLTKLEKMD